MHPIITQALVAERVREWRDRAARERFAAQSRQARREARPGASGRPLWPAFRRRTQAPVAAGLPDEVAGVADDRQPAGHRAA